MEILNNAWRPRVLQAINYRIKRIMKKFMVILPMSAMTLFVSLPSGATAQIAVVEVIKAGVKKVIKAVDLKIQRLQNETIWLQNRFARCLF